LSGAHPCDRLVDDHRPFLALAGNITTEQRGALAFWHLRASGVSHTDSTVDLLWQNDDGTAAIWKTNGSSFLGGGDSKLRGCDLVRLQVDVVCTGGRVRDRATVIQKKTGRPVQFEITEQNRASIQAWLPKVDARNGTYLFPSRFRTRPHLSTRQYARILHGWVVSAGLDGSAYGTHSMRRTKAAQIYKKTGNLRAVQLLLGHTKLESTVRYLGIEVDDALSISEQVEL
jgi:hypothetical protein